MSANGVPTQDLNIQTDRCDFGLVYKGMVELSHFGSIMKKALLKHENRKERFPQLRKDDSLVQETI